MREMYATASGLVMPFLDPFAPMQGSQALAAALRLALMRFFGALLALIERQPAVSSNSLNP